MSVKVINKENFNEVLTSDKPVLLDFFATWCGPCRMVSPIVDEIAEGNATQTEWNFASDRVTGDLVLVPVFIEHSLVDVDEEPELAAEFDVSSIPTLVVLKEGKVAEISVGARPKPHILKMLEG